jgi:hypothetical protein
MIQLSRLILLGKIKINQEQSCQDQTTQED